MIVARMPTTHPIGTCAWMIVVCLVFRAAAAFGQDDPGKTAYTRACETCHGPGGNGDAQGPPLVLLAHNLAELTAIVRQGVGLMPAMPRSEVSDADIEQLYSYLKRISAGSMRRDHEAAVVRKGVLCGFVKKPVRFTAATSRPASVSAVWPRWPAPSSPDGRGARSSRASRS